MGETGSGKTTQLPQYIQDARLINGQIGVTQVRIIFVLCFTNKTVKVGVKVDLLYQGLTLNRVKPLYSEVKTMTDGKGLLQWNNIIFSLDVWPL